MANQVRSRMSGGAIIALIAIAALIIFMVQNTEKIRVHFLVWHFSLSIWLLILIALLIGGVAWFGLGVIRRHRRSR